MPPAHRDIECSLLVLAERQWALVDQVPDEAVPCCNTSRIPSENTAVAYVQNLALIQTLVAHRAHTSFGHRIRLRCVKGRQHDFDALSDEDIVERCREFGVVVVNQETHRLECIGELPDKIADLLVDPRIVGR
ncbi:MAG: hypothetical protein ACYDBJ_15165 [Aggregatilineales bacterium]